MKKSVLISFFSFFLSVTLFAQRGRTILAPDLQPLIIVNSFMTDFKHLLLKPDNIISMDVLKNERVIAAYGDKAKNGVIVIHIKKHTEIFRLTDIFEHYQIPDTDRKLKVCIDNVQVSDSSLLVIDKADIATVEVITDICWVTPQVPGPEERYINIASKQAWKPIP